MCRITSTVQPSNHTRRLWDAEDEEGDGETRDELHDGLVHRPHDCGSQRLRAMGRGEGFQENNKYCTMQSIRYNVNSNITTLQSLQYNVKKFIE